jgi:hypothetical protein
VLVDGDGRVRHAGHQASADGHHRRRARPHAQGCWPSSSAGGARCGFCTPGIVCEPRSSAAGRRHRSTERAGAPVCYWMADRTRPSSLFWRRAHICRGSQAEGRSRGGGRSRGCAQRVGADVRSARRVRRRHAPRPGCGALPRAPSHRRHEAGASGG